MAETAILLESGTNEIEIMEFTINDESYGINVAKVREILIPERVKSIPHSHPAVEGIFKPRDILLTVVNLPFYLNPESGGKTDKDLFIITNFNKLNIAFRVHGVEGISRISWKNIQKPDSTITRGEEGVATGIAQCNGKLVTILDFEKIVADIAPQTGIQIEEIEEIGASSYGDRWILVAEDSVLLTNMIEMALKRAGYTNLVLKANGQEAWDYLTDMKNGSEHAIDLIITDIEMPEMDGHRLTKLVKSDSELKKIPLVIFSSLINHELMLKGRSLGADEQLSKPEIGHLVEVINRLLERAKVNG